MPELSGEGPSALPPRGERALEKTVLPLLLLVASPLFVLFVGYALTHGDASVAGALHASAADILRWSAPTWRSFAIITGFVAFEYLLLVSLPGGVVLGPLSPAGQNPAYRDNGLLAWALTHAAFYAAGYSFRLFSPTIVYDELGRLVATSSIVALVLCIVLYLRGRYRPSKDTERTGSVVFDFVRGIELHPLLRREVLRVRADLLRHHRYSA